MNIYHPTYALSLCDTPFTTYCTSTPTCYHTYQIEEIRKRIFNLERTNWKIEVIWVKAHAGIYGNELADRLAKAAAYSNEITVTYNRIPKSTLYSEIEEEATQQWQSDWTECKKAAATKKYFPDVHERNKMKINPTFTAMVTGHGKTRSYLHRFKIAESETCPCNEEAQTTDHLLYRCKLTQTQRDLLRETVSKSGSWP